jgi:hypothetical protein
MKGMHVEEQRTRRFIHMKGKGRGIRLGPEKTKGERNVVSRGFLQDAGGEDTGC